MRPSILLAKSIFSFREIEPKETRNLPTFDVGVGQRASLQGLSCGFGTCASCRICSSWHTLFGFGAWKCGSPGLQDVHPVVHVCVFFVIVTESDFRCQCKGRGLSTCPPGPPSK